MSQNHEQEADSVSNRASAQERLRLARARIEAPAPFRERPEVKFLRPTHHEGFNVMKNHGHEFERDFGHGRALLAMTLAFAWRAVFDLLEPPWNTAHETPATRTSFFAHILMPTTYLVFPSWSASSIPSRTSLSHTKS
jgi:hypothetical protein